MLAYYDATAREMVVLIDDQRLTIPDYMTVGDISFFIEDKLLQSTKRMMQQATYETEQESPLEKARAHYKNLGWFKENTDGGN